MALGRRRFCVTASGAAAGALLGTPMTSAQIGASETRVIETPTLAIAYEEQGNPLGFPVILLHGFPDDVRAWDGVVAPLVDAGFRTLVPYLRGVGPTRFHEPSAPRTGEQAAIGQDLIDFADALTLPRFAVAGFDWGNRAACIAAALHPQRVRAGVFIHGYSIQNPFAAPQATAPDRARALWYQFYFNTEHGRAGLQQNRKALCRFLWESWSPSWRFTSETYDRTAPSFDNPDFVDVVIHSYRHRIGNAPSEPRFEAVEQRLAKRPGIDVPAIVLHGGKDGVALTPPAEAPERALFSKLVERRVVEDAGHFLPRERPAVVAAALLKLLGTTR
jgi:pimeloyl-ACP methyl ester carboxylesterase